MANDEASRPVILEDPEWQMMFGERAALEGLLSTLRPALSIEIGTAEGGSLRRIAAHSEEVHAFDLDLSRVEGLGAGKVHLHEGDSSELLPGVLAEFAAQGRSLDFALVDGSHTTEGVRADVSALLGSPVAAGATIMLHDTMNPEVRAGIEQAASDHEDVQASIDLDFVPGFLTLDPPFETELWGGLGLLLIGANQELGPRRVENFRLLASERALRVGDGMPPPGNSVLLARLHQLGGSVKDMRGALSWRLTAPLRAVKRWIRSPSGSD